MKATVIVTTYKQSAILKYILLSLLSQRTEYTYEIIVCDDGGTDNSISIINELRVNEKKIKIHYLWQQDRGFRAASARNMGISKAKGDIIILLDGDMIPKLDYVQRHIVQHLKNPKTLLTGGRLSLDDSDFFRITNKTNNFPEILKLFNKKSFLNTEELKYRKSWYYGSKPWMSVFSCNLSFPRSEIAKYSELFVGWGIEDWDLSKRLYENGYKIKFDDSIIAYHIDYKPVISNAFRNNNHKQLVEFARNLLLFIDQYPLDELSECAIALKSYSIANDKFVWAGDGKNLRSEKDAINMVRDWLSNKNIYSINEQFYVQKDYISKKELLLTDRVSVAELATQDRRYEILELKCHNLEASEFIELLRAANSMESVIRISA